MQKLYFSGILIGSQSASSCNDDLTITGQTEITSPNYGDNQTYPLQITCQWTITAPPGQVLSKFGL